MRTIHQLRVLLAITVSLVLVSGAQAIKYGNLHFSKEEVTLLKRIKQIEDGAAVASSMLKAAPFVQILTAPGFQDVGITITTNDWDMIGEALQGLGKIKACQVVKEIDLFTVDAATEPSMNPNAAFFGALRKRYDQGC